MDPAAVENDVVGILQQNQIPKPAACTICSSISDFQADKAVVIGPGVVADDPVLVGGSADASHHVLGRTALYGWPTRKGGNARVAGGDARPFPRQAGPRA